MAGEDKISRGPAPPPFSYLTHPRRDDPPRGSPSGQDLPPAAARGAAGAAFPAPLQVQTTPREEGCVRADRRLRDRVEVSRLRQAVPEGADQLLCGRLGA